MRQLIDLFLQLRDISIYGLFCQPYTISLMGVAALFQTFCNELLIGSDTRSIIATRYNAICTRLNKDFWKMEITSGGRYLGSFGRNTANGRVGDIDMIFEMPLSTYNIYNSYISNGQSGLLQAVKQSIQQTYSSADVRGDGQVVQVEGRLWLDYS